jgi:group I intron endonuclease
MIGIYKITSPTNRIYIGSSNNIANRISSYKNLKCKSQTKLYRSLKKYGFTNHLFEIIEECSINILLEREAYYGVQFNVLDKKFGLNCRIPKSTDNYICMSDSTKSKIGKANKLANKNIKVGHYESKLKKLTIMQILEIKNLLIENKLTQKEIGLLYNVSRKIIGNINTGKTYKTLHTNINLDLSKKKYIKLALEDYKNIKKLNKEGMNQTKIAKQYNIDTSHVSRILNNQRYIKSLLSKEGEVSN